jgi:cell division protein FtsL
VANVATARLVGWILSAVALCIIVGVTSMAYIETLYMRANLKRAEKRIEKKLEELEKLKQELKEK